MTTPSTKISKGDMKKDNQKSIAKIDIVYPDIVQIQMEDYCKDLKIIIVNSNKIFNNK